ncbi:hypothetical protein D1646_07565 [Pseudoflavonifractor sp. 60]|uniref:hypothetical protein n=1 Tax=Pseudoflavonifractor sp. 60 TaxID=2304576 RepID=UPI00136CEAA8|nr:hypothetical protein [Pseudoflavonifractor sp. 60]NBI66677.1 hypothetical protein [Pseudoflavonifractor sp. 60]
MWWKTQPEKTLLTGAIIWTVAFAAALLNVLCRHNSWWVIVTFLFAVNAAIRWITYAKQQQEVNHEEKESP